MCLGWEDSKPLLHGCDLSTVVRYFKGDRVGALRGVGVRDLVFTVGQSVSVVPARLLRLDRKKTEH